MKKVLLATDGSSSAEEAAWLLSHLPHGEKLDLYVLTVLQFPYSGSVHRSPSSVSESVDRERAAAVEAFERVAAMFQGANARLQHVMREGHRGQCIVEAGEELGVSLTVVGARGRSAVRRLLLGSTSDYVATHSHCSVLVVRATGLRDQSRPIRIAIGYEETGAAEAALREFAETPWGRQCEVRVVSVVSYASVFLNEIVVEIDEVRSAASKSANAAADQIRSAAPTVQVNVIESDHVGEGLTTFTEEDRCDLIVVGETPHSALGRVILGSVSRFVLRHAPCSVWITRAPGAHKDAGNGRGGTGDGQGAAESL